MAGTLGLSGNYMFLILATMFTFFGNSFYMFVFLIAIFCFCLVVCRKELSLESEQRDGGKDQLDTSTTTSEAKSYSRRLVHFPLLFNMFCSFLFCSYSPFS
jgi:O-antigen ligase